MEHLIHFFKTLVQLFGRILSAWKAFSVNNDCESSGGVNVLKETLNLQSCFEDQDMCHEYVCMNREVGIVFEF